MSKKKSKTNKEKLPPPGDASSIPEQRPPTGVEIALAKILKPFQNCNPDMIRKKASLVGNTKNGGQEVMEIIDAAYDAYRVVMAKHHEEEQEAIAKAEHEYNNHGDAQANQERADIMAENATRPPGGPGDD